MSVTKAKYWCAVFYPENARDDWQDVIGDVIGFPLAYCVHDKDHLAKYKAKQGAEDSDRQRKVHVHLIIAYGNTTTANTVLTLVNRLSVEGKRCANKVEQCFNVRNSYEYLIHNTETAKKQGKFLYDEKERVCLNNFDIGSFEQLSIAEKDAMMDELEDAVLEMGFTSYASFFRWVVKEKSHEYRRLVRGNSSHLRNLVKGNYHDALMSQEMNIRKARELRARELKKAYEVEAREVKKAHGVEAREVKKAHGVEARELKKMCEVLHCDPETGELIED